MKRERPQTGSDVATPPPRGGHRREDQAVDKSALQALRREVECLRLWGGERDRFAADFQKSFGPYISEPKKFYRHCREALAKWVLSQVARAESLDQPHHFFPQTAKTFDDQLIRDLSKKCRPDTPPEVITAMTTFVRASGLSSSCARHGTAVNGLHASASQVTGVRVDVVENVDRVHGPAVDLRILFTESRAPNWFNRATSGKLVVPIKIYEKLQRLYRFFTLHQTTVEAQASALSEVDERDMALRITALVLRYDKCLFSGSLQLCADSAWKNACVQAGHHVIDLCASPINSYQGPDLSSPSDLTAASYPPQPLARQFCSAFVDTDAVFGSLGSGVTFEPAQFAARAAERQFPAAGPAPNQSCVFTLDVPYDEDLCELMLGLLVSRVAAAAAAAAAGGVDTPNVLLPETCKFFLCLPLWWDLPTPNGAPREVVVRAAADADTTTLESRLAEACVEVKKHLAELPRYDALGYPVTYEWSRQFQRLASPWATFNGLFLRDDYTYFDASLNTALPSVTMTQLIAVEPPDAHGTSTPSLGDLLKRFYPNRRVLDDET
jgi:hypothetical protein